MKDLPVPKKPDHAGAPSSVGGVVRSCCDVTETSQASNASRCGPEARVAIPELPPARTGRSALSRSRFLPPFSFSPLGPFRRSPPPIGRALLPVRDRPGPARFLSRSPPKWRLRAGARPSPVAHRPRGMGAPLGLLARSLLSPPAAVGQGGGSSRDRRIRCEVDLPPAPLGRSERRSGRR